MDRTLPGSSSFYTAGQWVASGGGILSAVISGRNLIQITCRKDKKHFTTTTPEVVVQEPF